MTSQASTSLISIRFAVGDVSFKTLVSGNVEVGAIGAFSKLCAVIARVERINAETFATD